MESYRFEGFELDLSNFELRRGQHVLELQPKVFDVLRYLVEHRDRVVTKQELLRELWNGEYVTDTVVSWSVSHIRRVLEQKRGDKRPIETIYRRGYRFRAEVAHTPGPSASQAPIERPPEGASQPPPPVLSRVPPKAPALVGRQRVMEPLSNRIRGAAQGRGGMALLTGEAGIGKTRCAEELLEVARGLGMQTLSGRCASELGAPPLWPLASALRQLTHADAALSARAHGLLVSGAPEAAGEVTDTGSAGFEAIERAAKLLESVSAAHPTILMLDDLQWADLGTLRLLAFLGPALGALPLFVLCTHRDADERMAGAREQTRLQMLRHTQTVELGALDRDQVTELVEVVGGWKPPKALADAIRNAAGGVPLFVQEVVRTLELEHGGKRLDTLSPSAVRVPDLARDLLRDRVDRLPDATVDVLSHAAVLGERFDLSVLCALVELEPDDLLEHLEPASKEGQLQSDGPHAYRFAHSMLRTVIYDDLQPRQRIAIHRRAAVLLDARPEGERLAGEVARHYYLSLPAGDHDVVMRRARTAGNEAMRLFAFDEAALYFGWALEAQSFAGKPDIRRRAELLLSLAHAQRSAGRNAQAMEAAAQAIHLAQQEKLHDVVVRATVLRRPTVAMGSLPDPVARAALETVVRASDDEGPARVRALAQLAILPPFEPDLSRSASLSARAVELAEKHGDRDLMLDALRARLFSLSGPGDIQELLAVAERMQGLIREMPAAWQAGEVRTAQYNAYVLLGEMDRADAILDQMAARVGGTQLGEANFFLRRLRAQRLFLDGEFARSDELWQEALARATRAGLSYAEMFHSIHVFNLRLEREGPRAMLDRVRASLASPRLMQGTRASLLRTAAAAGDLELVRAHLDELGDPAGFARGIGYLHMLASVATCAAALGDRARCEQLRDFLSPHAQLNTPDVMGFYLGSVSHFLGLLHAALGDCEAADASFTHADTRNRAMGYRAGVVRTALARGQLELQRGQRARAQELLDQACTQADRLKMQWVAAAAADTHG